MSVPSLLAHALVDRQDLPIPEWLFAWAASLVLVVSFVALSLGWREPKLERDRWRPGPGWLSALIAGRVIQIPAGAASVLLLAAVVCSGLAGTESPDRNFSITFVFVTSAAGRRRSGSSSSSGSSWSMYLGEGVGPGGEEARVAACEGAHVGKLTNAPSSSTGVGLGTHNVPNPTGVGPAAASGGFGTATSPPNVESSAHHR